MKTTYRLYHLVMYNLSPIQKGIQAGHAALEYAEDFGDTPEYRSFIENDKTWIILDGGGSEQIKNHVITLGDIGVNYSIFIEPDLNNAVSCITFLVSERVYEASINGMRYETMCGDPLSYQETELKKFLEQFHLAR